MRLIDADALKGRMLAETPEHEKGVADLFLEAVAAMIDEQPTIEERKKGKWVHNPDPMAGEGYWYCSECGRDTYTCFDYCPNCGAKMGD